MSSIYLDGHLYKHSNFVNSRLEENSHLKPIFWIFLMIYETVEIYEYEIMVYDIVSDT